MWMILCLDRDGDRAHWANYSALSRFGNAGRIIVKNPGRIHYYGMLDLQIEPRREENLSRSHDFRGQILVCRSCLSRETDRLAGHRSEASCRSPARIDRRRVCRVRSNPSQTYLPPARRTALREGVPLVLRRDGALPPYPRPCL